MNYFHYNGEKIPYRIDKSNRKTISIRVNGDGIVVRAPKYLNNGKIEELVEKKKQWIVEKYHEMNEMKPKIKSRNYEEGCQFLYRGKIIGLRYQKEDTSIRRQLYDKVWIEEESLCVMGEHQSMEVIKHMVEQWYRGVARKRIEERVAYYTSRYDFEKSVNQIFIKDQKSRWGSCSSKSNLNFNYRLIMAPDHVLDYVVVHELCHLKYMNHSSLFWSAIQQIIPNYETSKEWLRKNGGTLYL